MSYIHIIFFGTSHTFILVLTFLTHSVLIINLSVLIINLLTIFNIILKRNLSIYVVILNDDDMVKPKKTGTNIFYLRF